MNCARQSCQHPEDKHEKLDDESILPGRCTVDGCPCVHFIIKVEVDEMAATMREPTTEFDLSDITRKERDRIIHPDVDEDNEDDA